jgi:hypothetical protein
MPIVMISLSSLVLLILVLKNHLLAARSVQTQSVKRDTAMGKHMLINLGILILEFLQGVGVEITAGAVLA